MSVARLTWPERLAWAALPLFVALFLLWPELDLAISRALYRPDQGFVWRDHPVVRALYLYVPWAGRALLVAVLIVWVAGRLRARWVPAPWRRGAGLMLLSAILGPGLLIEGLLKPFWQRPRPVQVLEFGGSQVFEPVLNFCATCFSHHSFVSSHAAAGFALLALGLAAAPRQRARWLLVGLAAGAAVGAGRVLQGGHFTSDIVFAFYATWLPAQLVWWWDGRRPADPTGRNHRPEAGSPVE